MGAENIFTPQHALLYLAPVGTAAPEGPTVTMPAAWKSVGMFTPDSLNWSGDPEFQETEAHQSAYPVKVWQTKDAANLEVELLEWSGDNFKAVYGGGTIEAITPAGGGAVYYKYTPPSIGSRTEVAACLELGDGTRRMRRIIPRCMQREGVQHELGRDASATLPMNLSVLGSDVGSAFYDFFSAEFASFAPPTP
ncbi:hypothetical protein SAMN05421505_12088 [Sinosporangium album]|uniref:Phage major tail protein, phi13 family n=1 Tax=Sinosporangium album TaxID=504805 RepID=A0A1G8EGK2_9ACTN|nr:hypothetical protein [Sinosporangium album]SDH68910.1 hypothetical protein SAMN05421505_12088 [Sinosporangium album]